MSADDVCKMQSTIVTGTRDDRTIHDCLDRKAFDMEISLVAIKIPAKACSDYLKRFTDVLYQRPKIKKIYNVENEPQSRLIILNETFQDLTLSDLPDELHRINKQVGGVGERFQLRLDYQHFAADEVLRRLLPSSVTEVPCSFEQAGHLAHMNLREEALPYKYLIAQVIMDKNPTIRTVVNKIGNIETEYRTFPMELLAGEKNYEVTLRESNAKFTFNFANVYWNSRLQMEHGRLVDFLQCAAIPHHPGAVTMESSSTSIGGATTIPPSTATVACDASTAATATTTATAGCDTTVPTTTTTTATTATTASPPTTSDSRSPLLVADMMGGVGPFAIPLTMQSSLNTHDKNHINNNNNPEKKPQAKQNANNKPQKAKDTSAAATNTMACRRPIIVHANDLNPESYKYLVRNAQQNRCALNGRLFCYNMDGRDFILKLITERVAFEEVIMNLPQSATDFLDVFIGLHTRRRKMLQQAHPAGQAATSGAGAGAEVGHLDSAEDSIRILLPRIHVYAFSTAIDDPVGDIVKRCSEVLQCPVSAIRTGSSSTSTSTSSTSHPIYSHYCEGHIVRDVAPKKVMVCLSFSLPLEVATAEPLCFVPYEQKKKLQQHDSQVKIDEMGKNEVGGKRRHAEDIHQKGNKK
eukprot:CAMPEP_0174983836 /NCGR_PEP_ID=MMETSP0004_2-20121128/17376_1 /TAXON_ID=420556 /ORGANISM="Ochromonas sp., Strain CCMP1393" /LENGTH=637 /DNA_ID=CAMNT_0016236155 /DNA_START=218 /DNA_END=2131 /DNA_ORIENTATION=-